MESILVFAVALCSACVAGLKDTDFVFKIEEELEIGTYVGNISDNNALFRNLSAADKRSLQFGILDKNREPASLFTIDESTGVLRVGKRIDREDRNVCDYMGDCTLKFSVAVHSTTFSNVVSVWVYVQDSNDNAPSFPATEVHLGISEGAKVQTVLKISGAVDRDFLPNYTVQKYSLSQMEDVFSLTADKNPDGTSVINLKLEKPLDRENKSRYDFDIIAFDGGSPPKNGTLAVTVNVTDENDHRPTFLNSSYDVKVKEDTKINTTIVKISATDPDLNGNGRVTYRYSNMLSSKIQSLFLIEPETGNIKVAGKLEFDTSSPYHLIVEAVDGGNPPLKTQAVVTVYVQDSGNNSPIVRINTLLEGNTRIPESAGKGFFVAFVEVEDSDIGRNGDVQCKTTSKAFELQIQPGKGYKLLVKGQLDREATEKYNVSVRCWDDGKPSLSTTKYLEVSIIDVNDNKPRFVESKYNVSIPENSEIGRFVLRVNAQDWDKNDNGKILYYLETSAQSRLRIQHTTGTITTNTNKFDREVLPVYKFKVFAIDQGSPALTGTTEVTLNITDVNDNSPVFTEHMFRFDILENLEGNTDVGNVTGYDLDEGKNGEIEYFIAESPDGPIPFTVLPNGTVRTTQQLDREEKPNYTFTVLARDKGTPPRTNSSEVKINVLDENDNSPLILFPKGANHTIVISTLPEKDSVISRIVAYDADFGENGSMQFTITDGNEDGVFVIDGKTGETKVVNLWKLKAEEVYDLTITVQDSGVPPLSAETHLIVDVKFDNISDPTLMHGKSDKYMIIAAAVAGATCILSVVIIAAICFILRTDKKNAQSPKEAATFHSISPKDATGTVTEKQHSAIHIINHPKDPNIASASPQTSSKQSEPGNKKKEVSFSLDDSTDAATKGLRTKDLIFTNNRLTYLDDKVLHLDDVHSDTSGETIPSDSGRGGSEEEVNFPSMSDTNTRLLWDAPVYGSKSHSFDQCFPSPRKHNDNYSPHKQHHVRFVHTNSFQEGRDFSSRSHSHDKPYDYISRQGNLNSFGVPERSRDFNSRPLSYQRQTSIISQDDDVSTTTSGSYTINHDDFFEDGILGKDVIV